ncbi:hypothetical protein OS493_020387 [Desmophyllum pertusum]|uniref:GTP cyclohydrolase 1 feedback regulatory protein n=1 Tax=Desmophyllum pertusum TaxID=174260 RepID=A0A9X0D4Q9_9CNID|nr:hypothetical protein OS493_020387 [Desmophyllum pertusum]
MPYILVHNTMNVLNPEQPFQTRTYLDFYQRHQNLDACSKRPLRYRHANSGVMEGMLANLVSEESSPYRTYWTQEPPYAVLNRLEGQGYTVVAVNTVKETSMWTLHKPDQK